MTRFPQRVCSSKTHSDLPTEAQRRAREKRNKCRRPSEASYAGFSLARSEASVTSLRFPLENPILTRFREEPGNETRHVSTVSTHADDNPFRFSTKVTDDETGLVYYGYRYYSPILGRWISRDPIGEKGGLNLARLSRNQPISYVDALGLQEPAAQGPTLKVEATNGGPRYDCEKNKVWASVNFKGTALKPRQSYTLKVTQSVLVHQTDCDGTNESTSSWGPLTVVYRRQATAEGIFQPPFGRQRANDNFVNHTLLNTDYAHGGSVPGSINNKCTDITIKVAYTLYMGRFRIPGERNSPLLEPNAPSEDWSGYQSLATDIGPGQHAVNHADAFIPPDPSPDNNVLPEPNSPAPSPANGETDPPTPILPEKTFQMNLSIKCCPPTPSASWYSPDIPGGSGENRGGEEAYGKPMKFLNPARK